MAYNITLEGKNQIAAENLLKEIAIILDQLNITYCLEGGTLLGIYRENRLLPWDSDLDLSILEDELHKIDLLTKLLREKKYRIRYRYCDTTDTYFTKGKLRILKIRKQHFFGLLKSPVCLEIFIKYKIEDQVFWKVSDKTMGAPFQFYQTIKKILFQGHEYSIPGETEAYLTHKYGDWKTPVKEWNAMVNEGSIVSN
jgi:phosphorylcholine metabolism protein LicD